MSSSAVENVINAKSTAISPGGAISVTNVYQNQRGPVPYPTGLFQANGGLLVLEVSASAFSATVNANIGVTIELNGANLGACQLFANQSGTHVTCTPVVFQAAGNVGQNTIVVTPIPGTSIDSNDRLNVTVTEYVPAGK